MFKEEIIDKARSLGYFELTSEYTKFIEEHKKRYIYKTKLSPQLINSTEPKVLFGCNCLRFIQSALFRSRSLINGAIVCLNIELPLPSYICVRSHFETTACIAFLLKRLLSYYKKTIDFDRMNHDLLSLALGSSKLENPKVPKPIQVMNMIDAVDELLKKMTKEQTKSPDIFRDSYEWLSDFCHPNFQGMSLGSEIIHEEKAIIFSEEAKLKDAYLTEFFYLNISVKLFLQFYDEIFSLISKNEVMPIIIRNDQIIGGEV